MGCLHTKLSAWRSKKSKKSGKGNNDSSQVKVTQVQPTARLSGDEILQQLRDEGVVPCGRATGGVAFSVPGEEGSVPRGKPPRRLERLSRPGHYTAEERHIIAEVYRFDKMVEQVQKKALEREIKHKMVKDEKKRREFIKKMMAEHQLQAREERLKRLEEKRAAKMNQSRSRRSIEKGTEETRMGWEKTIFELDRGC